MKYSKSSLMLMLSVSYSYFFPEVPFTNDYLIKISSCGYRLVNVITIAWSYSDHIKRLLLKQRLKRHDVF